MSIYKVGDRVKCINISRGYITNPKVGEVYEVMRKVDNAGYFRLRRITNTYRLSSCKLVNSWYPNDFTRLDNNKYLKRLKRS